MLAKSLADTVAGKPRPVRQHQPGVDGPSDLKERDDPMPILHSRPARTPLLVSLEWLAGNFPHLCGGGVLIGASTAIADAGAPGVVTWPIGLLSVWPLGVVVRETVHNVRSWHIRQRRMHAEFLRAAAAEADRIYVVAERAVPQPAQLPASRPALPPAHAIVVDGQVAEREPR